MTIVFKIWIEGYDSDGCFRWYVFDSKVLDPVMGIPTQAWITNYIALFLCDAITNFTNPFWWYAPQDPEWKNIEFIPPLSDIQGEKLILEF